MTGPEHYREAERLAAILLAGKDSDGWCLNADRVARIGAAANVHAQLALAAATAAASAMGMPVGYWKAWHAVAGEKS
ncbi:hypothetical protein [Amycolatopsis sp. NPDC102389]|uniref:hypothetical protein n=1 Tax=Amycolatopsis sp. NPDC102389 TaxID=3363941 RepID=UPI003814F533